MNEIENQLKVYFVYYSEANLYQRFRDSHT